MTPEIPEPKTEKTRFEIAGQMAASLSAIEIGIGSFLHAMHVPMAGTLLSLNQAAFLTHAAKKHQHREDVKSINLEISLVTALLKSLSPAGKKITPMIAISAQGLLFHCGLTLFGTNMIGVMVSAMLLSTWGIAQPIFQAGLMYHVLSNAEKTRMIAGWQKLASEFAMPSQFNLVQALAAVTTLKCVASALIVAWIWRTGRESLPYETIGHHLRRQGFRRPVLNLTSEKPKLSRVMISAARDLKDPMLWATLIFISAVGYVIDSDLKISVVSAIRMLAGMYVTFLLLRLLPLERLLKFAPGASLSLDAAIKRLSSS